MSLGSKVALITGASQGIGQEIARVLASQGMAVAVNVRSDKAEQVAQALRQQGYQAQAFIADISRKAEVEAMFEQVEAQPGPCSCWSTRPACCGRGRPRNRPE